MPSSDARRAVCGLGLAALLSGCAMAPEQLALRQRLEAGVQTPDDAVRFKTRDVQYVQLVASGQDWPPASATAAQDALLQAAAQGQVNVVRSLLRAGARPDGRGGALSPLAGAALGGHAEVVRLLLAKGAQVDANGDAGEAPLMLAVRLNRMQAATVLLEGGASLQVRNRQGDSLCMVAINENLPDMLALLLRHGANPGTPDRDGLTPLYWTTFYQRDGMTRLLLAAGAPPDVKKVSIPAAVNYSLGAF